MAVSFQRPNIIDERGTGVSAVKSKEIKKKTQQATKLWVKQGLYQQAGNIKIGHYRQNITPIVAIKGGIKSLDIIDERVTGVSAKKSKEIWKKKPANYRIMAETSMKQVKKICIGRYRRNIELRD